MIAAIAEQLAGELRGLAVDEAVVAGSLRRGEAEPHDADIVCRCADPGAVVRAICDGATSMTPRITSRYFVCGNVNDHRVDVWLAYPSQFGAALLWATGPVAFNQAMQLRAADLGYRMNVSGVWHAADPVLLAGENEQQIFDVLGIASLPPADRSPAHLVPVEAVEPQPLGDPISKSVLKDRRLAVVLPDGRKLRINGEVDG